jgi:hypothetical protein
LIYLAEKQGSHRYRIYPYEISKAMGKNCFSGKHFALTDIRGNVKKGEPLKKLCATSLSKTLPEKDTDPLEMEALALSRQ